MDNLWERSIPFFNIGLKEGAGIFKEFDRRIELLDLTPINVGCRNSNYKAHTNNGLFLLRICPLGDTGYKNEKLIWELFHRHIKLPQLLFVSENNNTQRVCLLYEYIHGISMQEMMVKGSKLTAPVLVQVAESAAYIHSHDVVNNGEFDTLDDYPPFLTWYDLFLEQEFATERLGDDVATRVKSSYRINATS